MLLNPYLNFDGQCDAAFKFYQQILGGKIALRVTNADTPMAEKTPPDQQGRIAHIRLEVDGGVLMGSDCPTEYFEKAQGIVLSLVFDKIADGERVFNALAKNGTIKMPFEKTFWAERFGMLEDQFGTPWMVNCEKAA
ncbi:3-demethylubiquinone-9 3-methyltransferase family protein [Collimonas fungivorans]|uniref:3-demethylubiquinone-9 3-methyltransferase family protein n=1 Tax=Collimonas fungivorans TaxID=158899 RepID=A0A127PGH3_9BURK|nr:glyoxalase/bleomycin resistance/extradiol dioxygenase family protein [Collimonas fungivorans]AMO96734.1 3-demethylubiquinone-9 3-methyltransferase family protein [Collimonas fungivorans]